MTVDQILARLKSLGDDARRKHNAKAGAPDNQFGVPMSAIRALAKTLKPAARNRELALRIAGFRHCSANRTCFQGRGPTQINSA